MGSLDGRFIDFKGFPRGVQFWLKSTQNKSKLNPQLGQWHFNLCPPAPDQREFRPAPSDLVNPWFGRGWQGNWWVILGNESHMAYPVRRNVRPALLCGGVQIGELIPRLLRSDIFGEKNGAPLFVGACRRVSPAGSCARCFDLHKF